MSLIAFSRVGRGVLGRSLALMTLDGGTSGGVDRRDGDGGR